MRNAVHIMALGCCLVLVPACSSDTTATGDVNIAGTWNTTVSSCVFGNPITSCTMTMVLAQSGTNVSGTGTLSHVTLGVTATMTITGTTSSNNAVTLSLSGNAFDADPDDTVQYAGTKTDATTITGTFSSTESITGMFTFKKQ